MNRRLKAMSILLKRPIMYCTVHLISTEIPKREMMLRYAKQIENV